MIKGQRKAKDPCPDCMMHRSRCLCAEIPSLKLRTRLSLVIHYKELLRATNSGRLACRAIEGAKILVRGRIGENPDLSELILPEYENVLFFPSDEALELTPDLFERPVHLIVPDGNWRQASKVGLRHPELGALKRVKITSANLARFHLRRETTEFGMSTLEAIAKAISILEGDQAAAPLLALYNLKLKRTLEGRGVNADGLVCVKKSLPSRF